MVPLRDKLRDFIGFIDDHAGVLSGPSSGRNVNSIPPSSMLDDDTILLT